MNIFIWGSYVYGNFGDDLMAVGLADYLAERGHVVSVCKLSEAHCRADSRWAIERDIGRGVAHSDLVVIGGGALLVNYGRLHPVDLEHWEGLRELISVLKDERKPFVAISVGGSGDEEEELPEEILSLFKSEFFLGVTVRLPSDVVRLLRYKISATYHTDIVFSVASAMTSAKVASASSGGLRVGVNLPEKIYSRVFLFMLKVLSYFGVIHSVTCIDTYLKSSEVILAKLGKRRELECANNIKFERCESFLSSLAELDVVISYKLHVGVAMLALGGGFVSVGGKAKTKALLRYHELPSIALSLKTCIFFIWSLFSRNRQSLTMEKTASLVEDAEGHLITLNNWIMKLLK